MTGETAAVAAGCGVLGLVVGSFLNVVTYRVPRHESVVTPGSHCPGCGTPIAARDNVPVLSWLVLRGRCRTCRARISVRYPAVELLTGILFMGAGIRFGAHVEVIDYCVFFAVLEVLAFIDLDTRLVPRRIVWPALGATGALLTVASAVGGDWRRLEDAAIGGAAAFGALFVIHVIQPRGMGFGDVRLAALIGVNLGWLGLAHVAVGLFLGFLLGAVVGVVLVVAGRGGRRTAVPFAPFLAAGAVVAVYWGGRLVHLWLGG